MDVTDTYSSSNSIAGGLSRIKKIEIEKVGTICLETQVGLR